MKNLTSRRRHAPCLLRSLLGAGAILFAGCGDAEVPDEPVAPLRSAMHPDDAAGVHMYLHGLLDDGAITSAQHQHIDQLYEQNKLSQLRAWLDAQGPSTAASGATPPGRGSTRCSATASACTSST